MLPTYASVRSDQKKEMHGYLSLPISTTFRVEIFLPLVRIATVRGFLHYCAMIDGTAREACYRKHTADRQRAISGTVPVKFNRSSGDVRCGPSGNWIG